LKAVLALLIAALMTGVSYADPPLRSATATVSMLLDAIRRGDQASFTEVAPGLVFMAAPDMLVPINWNDALNTLGHCSLVSLSEPKRHDGVSYYIVAATMTCLAPLPPGPLPFGFIVDGEHVFAVYRGEMDPFAPSERREGDGVHP